MEKMEKEPLLGGKRSGHPSRNQFRYSRASISQSDDTVENSVYSYCGDNYNIPRPDRRITRSDTTSTGYEEPARKFHRPWFTCLVTIVHIALLIYICVVGGVETVAFKPKLENTSIHSFGYIALPEGNDSVHKENISRYSGVNWFIGPNSSFLVKTGAKFGPCMKKLKVLEERISNISKREASYACCSFRGECGMMKNTSCPGDIIEPGNCTATSPYCTLGVTLRPCCLGLHSQCQVTSEQYCSYQGGHWYKHELLCSHKVNCLDSICGMRGVKDKTGGTQGYRLITAIFLHLGVIHLLTNLCFQIPVGVLIEREIGSVRMALIYMISGIGGNLVCGTFDPLTPQAGASGALFGLLALLIVKLMQLRREVKRPLVESLVLLSVALISFALGTLPYIGNFVHIGGFVFGISASLTFLPRTRFHRCHTMAVYACFKGVSLLFLCVLIVFFCLLFFLVEDSNFCSWCKYIDCVPYTEHFCPSMYGDGFLNNGDAS